MSDQATVTLCPRDLYESDDKPEDRCRIYVNVPQLHDFHRANDADWVHFELPQRDQSLYVFTARPLEPDGVPISLTLLMDEVSLSGSNLDDPRSAVRISKVLSCAGPDRCGYPVRVQPASDIPAGGCWTDYELLVTETPEHESEHVFLPVVMKQ